MRKVDFDELTVSNLKTKIKTIRKRYSSDFTKVQTSFKSGTGFYHIYVPKLFWYKQTDIFLRSVCILRNSTSTQVNLNIIHNNIIVIHI